MVVSGYTEKDGIYRSPRGLVKLPGSHIDFTSFILSGKVTDASFAKKSALIDSSTSQVMTYDELHKQTRRIAAGLWEIGVRQHDVVLILLGNCISYPVIFLAAVSIGAVVTTSNPVYTKYEVLKQMNDSKPSWIITSVQFLASVEDAGLPLVLLGDITKMAVNAGVSFTPFSKLLEAPVSGVPVVKIHQDDTAALLYSSGTTGMSKGVRLTHKNFIAASLQVDSIHDTAIGLEEDTDMMLCMLPMFHSYGLVMACAEIKRGFSFIIMPRYSLESFLEAIQKFKVTHIPIVPPIMVSLGKNDLVLKYDLSSLKELSSGGAPLDWKTVMAVSSRLPHCQVKQGYGLTESMAMGTASLRLAIVVEHDITSGVLVASCEAKVVDAMTGQALPPNQRGELWLRGPNIMHGYLNNPEANDATIDADGWLHTGDVGYFDEENRLRVVDRLKELIKYKGLQIAPAELEALLLSHEEISDSAVVPLADEEAGQVPVAFVVRSPGSSLTEQVVLNFISKQVAPFKKLRRVTFVTRIPRSASGKVLRKQLSSDADAQGPS